MRVAILLAMLITLAGPEARAEESPFVTAGHDIGDAARQIGTAFKEGALTVWAAGKAAVQAGKRTIHEGSSAPPAPAKTQAVPKNQF